MRVRLRCVYVAIWAVTQVAVARAEERQRPLVILIDPAAPALAQRLRDEIESLGLDVAMAQTERAEEPLEARARAAGAIAAIRVTLRGSGAVEMTIVDRTTGKTVSRRLAIAMPTDPAAAELIATRTVELLRASLMELAAAHAARGDVPITPEVEALTSATEQKRESATFSLAAGPAILYDSDLGPSVDLWLALMVLTRARVGVTAQIFSPITPGQLTSREGGVELFASKYRLGGVLQLPPRRSALSTRLQAGVLLARLAVTGSANPPYTGASEDRIAWGPWLGAGLRLELTPGLGAWLGADLAWTLPRTVIRSAGREVATWGRPMGSGSAGLELTWQ